jgi:hypothetical protein
MGIKLDKKDEAGGLPCFTHTVGLVTYLLVSESRQTLSCPAEASLTWYWQLWKEFLANSEQIL